MSTLASGNNSPRTQKIRGRSHRSALFWPSEQLQDRRCSPVAGLFPVHIHSCTKFVKIGKRTAPLGSLLQKHLQSFGEVFRSTATLEVFPHGGSVEYEVHKDD